MGFSFQVAREDSPPVLSPVGSPFREPDASENSIHDDQGSTTGAAVESESGCEVPLPDLAPHSFCLMVLRQSPQMPVNHRLVIEQLVDHHPETFTPDCLRSNIHVMSHRLQGMAIVVAEIASTPTASVTRSLLNQFLGFLKELGRDGFRFDWLITHLKTLKNQQLIGQREVLIRCQEDQRAEEVKLAELAPLLESADEEVTKAEEALRLAKLKREKLLIERAQVQTRLEVAVNAQNSFASASSGLPGDFFSSPDLWFLLA